MTVEKRKYMNINAMTNYELIQQKELKDLKSEGYLLRHKKSGARVLLMENDDENKVFTIGFRTPPEDSTGLPHILEHSVLCGSKNFPVKDPFVELVKGSLNTFLNLLIAEVVGKRPIRSRTFQGKSRYRHGENRRTRNNPGYGLLRSY